MLRIIILFLFIAVSGCTTVGTVLETLSPTYAGIAEENRKRLEPDEVVTFQKLLNEDWDLYVTEDGKLILVKYTETGLLIRDVFGVLQSD